MVWAGVAEPWKQPPGFDAIAKLPKVTIVPLELTDARSVEDLAGSIGGKVDILINNAEFHRGHGIGDRRGTETARAEMDINYFGLLRLAQSFGPAMRARAAESTLPATAWVNILSIYALSALPGPGHVLGVEGRRVLAVADLARGDARRRHPRGQCISRSDRRRMDATGAAAEAGAGRARQGRGEGAEGRRRGHLSGRRGAGPVREMAESAKVLEREMWDQ